MVFRFIFLVSLVVSGCASHTMAERQPAPSWVNDTYFQLSPNQYFAAVGQADTLAQAQNNAVQNLALFFRANIRSTQSNSLSVNTSNSTGQDLESVERSSQFSNTIDSNVDLQAVDLSETAYTSQGYVVRAKISKTTLKQFWLNEQNKYATKIQTLFAQSEKLPPLFAKHQLQQSKILITQKAPWDELLQIHFQQNSDNPQLLKYVEAKIQSLPPTTIQMYCTGVFLEGICLDYLSALASSNALLQANSEYVLELKILTLNEIKNERFFSLTANNSLTLKHKDTRLAQQIFSTKVTKTNARLLPEAFNQQMLVDLNTYFKVLVEQAIPTQIGTL